MAAIDGPLPEVETGEGGITNQMSFPEDESVESQTFYGKSDCGFSDTIHDALMAAGQAVHRIVGEPNDLAEGVMKETGDFVKDTAVAMHDLGNADASLLKEETNELVKMMTSKDETVTPEDEAKADLSGGN
mmetsp:Transcript_20871/g.34496  ORF Transcript_20871/g.34496 Transcript_20871/m.34496 type:complete len:131 (+) Transcript_20871:58-450(+)|eukprot:CAMPEP_0119007604 /NCGR_PEP_ID=MMETSP1176-20130426/3124_1 /TAXON_ID=265551 /ORGANISM="Synedropsis recta cf, Strain CCMP1620" /LENGTH=130 /DNA_ID=CAMNT_0006959785 /DNA_START=56 /DNA_END=448 /DNA_ORIENTATION=-